ncbi:MAG: SUMF1/EgtB/PvdO family nonheme iron enzyme [Verrucomicrobiales bacterium]|nr:SUMF1/EgtB/PvdO family nonheme iron enzyme [Verrucomicrobiales bacterium]
MMLPFLNRIPGLSTSSALRLAAAGIISIALFSGTALAQVQAIPAVPGILNQQGRIAVNDVNHEGAGFFKFALIKGDLSETLWTNDGTATGAPGGEPTAAVETTLVKGHYAVPLGDTDYHAGMTNAIAATIFAENADVRLCVWFATAAAGPFEKLDPNQRVTSVGYALAAGSVANGAITSGGLAAGSVTTSAMADSSVTGMKIADATIGAVNLAPDSVTTAKILDGNITAAKLAPGAANDADADPTNELQMLSLTGSSLSVSGGGGSVDLLEFLQGVNPVAIGFNAGETTQGINAVALGFLAGETEQNSDAVAIGSRAGRTNQAIGAVAIGLGAGETDQSSRAVAMGFDAGRETQGIEAVAIGSRAGRTNQSLHAVALGRGAGETYQSSRAIAMGFDAGRGTQGIEAVAIGSRAGRTNQGPHAVAVGSFAGLTDQHANSIILNASGVPLDSVESGFFVDPIREATDSDAVLTYNPVTREITRALFSDISGTGLAWKTSVRVAKAFSFFGSNDPAALATDFENGDTIDGVVLATGDRILIADQADPTENGIYIVQASAPPTRADDLPIDEMASGTTVIVNEGTNNGDQIFFCVSDDGADLVGTDGLNFRSFQGYPGPIGEKGEKGDPGPAGGAEPPTDVFPVNGMAWIEPGTFLMGSRTDEPGRSSNETQHPVTLTNGFWMGVHEVTQAEYVAVTGLTNPSNFTGDTNRPVETVSWTSAVAYCAALTGTEQTASRIPAGWAYRLPTEAEWEYCCRAGARTTRFGYGDDLSASALGDYAWYSTNAGVTTHPVEQKRANAWGLMDMHGNVWEWCLDSSDGADYPGGSAAVTDPLSSSGSNRVIRGGNWGSSAYTARCAYRNSLNPGFANRSIGFRVVLAPVQP